MIDLVIVTERDIGGLSLLGHAPLARELARAIVVSTEAVPPDVVTMHSRVLFSDATLGTRRAVTLVYSRR